MIQHKFDYRWNLADAHFTKDKARCFLVLLVGGQFDGLQTCRV